MAKAPHSGSKVGIAEFIFDKVCKKNKDYKVIQPSVVAHYDDTFWWIGKIITLDGQDPNVRIPKKHESGFVIVSESSKHKFKIEQRFLEKSIGGTGSKKN